MSIDSFGEYSSDYVDRIYEMVMYVVRNGLHMPSDRGRPVKKAAPPPPAHAPLSGTVGACNTQNPKGCRITDTT